VVRYDLKLSPEEALRRIPFERWWLNYVQSDGWRNSPPGPRLDYFQPRLKVAFVGFSLFF
jgi:hypothetical protein